MTKNTEIQVLYTSSKALASESRSTDLAPLRIPMGGPRETPGVFNPPLPICRRCNAPVLWMRIQPDISRGQLKVTVGCRQDRHGTNAEPTDTFWLDLTVLQAATEVAPGYAFT